MVDTCGRTFRLYSNLGSVSEVECDTVDQFMSVLDVVTSNLNDDQIEYADLAIA